MSFLQDLLVATNSRVASAKAAIAEDALEQRIASAEPPRGFAAALTVQPSLIAEIKRATPSKGDIARDLDPRKVAAAYAAGGAAAISVLTEPDHFKGSLDDLAAAREAGLPVLLKDFVVDPFQIHEARAWGADAVLLIVRCVGDDLGELQQTVRALGMDALVEVFDETDMERALSVGADLIGINHRDLETFEVDLDRTAKLAPMVPDSVTVVALSGVSERAEVEALVAAGARAVLVGTSLVTADDPAAKIRELLGS